MSECFDAYHKWLGIPPAQQPPHHYRLLGVEVFETDREVIDAAANQRMAYLQELSVGEHLKESQRLLNEISAARRCLLNPQQKAAYDQQLRATQAVDGPEVTASDPSESPFPGWTAADDSLAVNRKPSGATRKASRVKTGARSARSPGAARSGKKQSMGTLIMWGATAVGAVVVLGLVAISLLLESGAASKPKPAVAVKTSQVTIHWRVTEREKGSLTVDEETRSPPATEEFTLPLKPGDHDFVFRRDGFEDLRMSRRLRPGEKQTIKVETKSWIQDLSRIHNPPGPK